jgi:hypothetical protein
MLLTPFTRGPQIHFWFSDLGDRSSPPAQTNSEGGERELREEPRNLPAEKPKPRELPPYHHVEIF